MGRIAICYWGLTRSTKHIYTSHQQHLYGPLKENGHTYDVFIHTWRTSTPRTWNRPDPPIDEAEGNFLGPTRLQIDDQDEWLKTVNMADYFYSDVWAKYGDNRIHGEWRPDLLQNHICALESLQRAYSLLPTDTRYDFIVFIRPDMELLAPFPAERLEAMGPHEILLTDSAHNEGYNDRFAVMRANVAEPYAFRMRTLKQYRKTRGRIVSEKVVKACIDNHYGPATMISFPMRRVRTDGKREPS